MSKNKRHIAIISIIIFVGITYRLQTKVTLSPQSSAQAEGIRNSAGIIKLKSIIAQNTVSVPNGGQNENPFKKSVETSSSAKLSAEQAYCRILRAHTSLTLGGAIKFFLLRYDIDEEGNAGFNAFIQSSDCPKDLFSKIRIDQFGRIKEVIDCKSTSREQISVSSGIQGNINDRMNGANSLFLAISGNGYFLTECPTGLYLQRSGDFQRRGQEFWRGACRLLNQDGEPFTWEGQELDKSGCTSSGVCPAIADPDPGSVTFEDRTTFKLDDGILPKIRTDGRVFNNALESLDDPDTGPMGPDFSQQKEFTPPGNCDGIE